jgi:hypothetical protein
MKLTPTACNCRHNCGEFYFAEAPSGMFHSQEAERIAMSYKLLQNIDHGSLVQAVQRPPEFLIGLIEEQDS